jgi:hypothetical protein
MLLILCVDGLDNELTEYFGLRMPYEARLSIPKELYKSGEPFTPNVWGSMFTGEIFVHSDTNMGKDSLRYRVRQFLHRLGIRWAREGTKVWKSYHESKFDRDIETIHFIWKREVFESVFNEFKSFVYAVPSISDNFIFTSEAGDYERHMVFKMLAENIQHYDYEVVALYTHYIDVKAHWTTEANKDFLRRFYGEVFRLVDSNSFDAHVMMVSDHATLLSHKDYAYIGCNFPFEAESVLDVADVVREVLK